MKPQFGQVETFTPENLVSGGPLHTREVTIASGQGKLAAGTALGVLTSGGKYAKAAVASPLDGAETPVAILAEAVDATSGEVTTVAYIGGEFMEEKVIFGTGLTAASTKDDLAANGIYLVSSVSA